MLATLFGTGCCLVFRTRAAHANVCLQPPQNGLPCRIGPLFSCLSAGIIYLLSIGIHFITYTVGFTCTLGKWRGTKNGSSPRLLQQSCNKAISRFAYFSVQLGSVWLSKKLGQCRWPVTGCLQVSQIGGSGSNTAEILLCTSIKWVVTISHGLFSTVPNRNTSVLVPDIDNTTSLSGL